MAGGTFKPGYDPRRNTHGRPPTGCATREIALELAEIADQPIKGKDGKETYITRKRALLERIYSKALAGDDAAMQRYLANLLFKNDFGLGQGPAEGQDGEQLDPEIEELYKELTHDKGPSEPTVRNPPKQRKKAGTTKKPLAKARARGSVLPPGKPARAKGRG